MSARALAAVVVALMIPVSWILWTTFIDSRVAAAQPARKTAAQRAEAGPYIAVTKDISKDETVRVLVIPHPMGDFFDTTCVIYTNREVGTATMNCPTAHQGEISVPEAERR